MCPAHPRIPFLITSMCNQVLAAEHVGITNRTLDVALEYRLCQGGCLHAEVDVSARVDKSAGLCICMYV